MGLYRRWLLPRITDWSMRNAMVIAERKRIVPTASGAVLEIGAGSGLNLPFYGPGVEKLYALEPSPEMWRLAKGRIAGVRFPVEFLPPQSVSPSRTRPSTPWSARLRSARSPNRSAP